jgi:hypothetical protein
MYQKNLTKGQILKTGPIIGMLELETQIMILVQMVQIQMVQMLMHYPKTIFQ